MLACTEMITMCLQSAKHEHLRRQQELDHNQNQGFSLVQDVSSYTLGGKSTSAAAFNLSFFYLVTFLKTNSSSVNILT